MNFEKIRLSNGLRLILIPNRHTRAVTVLVLFGVGSRYETKENNGISHFLEHLVFKGTKKRPSALELVEVLDKIGGIYNAYTAKEYTGYFAKVDSQHLKIAVDWLSDLVLQPLLREEDIERERKVIIQEIKMYLDTPMKYVGDLWERLLYKDSSLGRLVLGEEAVVRKMTRRDLVNYYQTHYSSLNSVVVVSGNFHPLRARELIKEYFCKFRKKRKKAPQKVRERQRQPQLLVYYKKTDQTHICLGVRGYDIFHKDKYALELLSVILGGNMSSRLFVEIREKRGLAYYVNTSTNFYTDSGYLVTQCGVAHDNLGKTVEVILENYRKIKREGVSSQELQKAKDYLKGVVSLSLETSDAQASFLGHQEILTNKIEDLETKFKKIDRVRPEDIQKVASDIFRPEKLNLALIGPFKNKKKIEKLLTI